MTALFKAYTLLAFAFVTTVLSRWFRLGSRYGLPAFNRNYAAEQLGAMRPEDNEVLVAAGRCIACRRCEQGDLPLLRRHPTQYPGLSRLVLASTRSMTTASSAWSAWRLLSEQELQLREALCPEGVPIAALAQLVQRHAGHGAEAAPNAAAS
jgi:hypothetical protein